MSDEQALSDAIYRTALDETFRHLSAFPLAQDYETAVREAARIARYALEHRPIIDKGAK